MTTTLITGIPRSGTTFVCACLNTIPDCVALAEPMSVPQHGNADRAINEIIRFTEATRARLIFDKVAPSKTVDGVITDNFFEEVKIDGGLRNDRSQIINAPIDKPLTQNFRLFVKHPGIFTALAESLAARIPLYVIVRHPLAVLASWQSVNANFRQGRMPVAEAFAPALRKRLDGIDNPLSRQVALVQWAFGIYNSLPRERVLKYESIVRNPGATLQPLSGSAAPISHPTRAFDLQTRYPSVDLSALAAALITIKADIEPFYPDIERTLHPHLGRS